MVSCAGGRSPAVTPARETVSRSRPTWAAAMSSTRRWRTSRLLMRTRPSAITRISLLPCDQDRPVWPVRVMAGAEADPMVPLSALTDAFGSLPVLVAAGLLALDLGLRVAL